jgi:acetyltransferase-like isoleucine patch superfamily enzyme
LSARARCHGEMLSNEGRSPRKRPWWLSSWRARSTAAWSKATIGPKFRASWSVAVRGSGISIGECVEVLGPTTVETLSEPDESLTIGDGCRIKGGTFINSYGGRVHLSTGCLVGHGSVLLGHGGLYIGKSSMLSPYVVIVASEHAYWKEGPLAHRGFTREPISIGRNVWIGSHVVVTGGAVIEDEVVVGAGSVVVGRLVSDYVYGGSPARALGPRAREVDEGSVHRWSST